MLGFANKKASKLKIDARLFKSDAANLPFENNFFDSAICTALLHCISSKRKREKILKEFYRVLKPGAQGFITVWNRTSKRLKNKPKKHKISWIIEGRKVWRDNYLYDYEELKRQLEEAGFKIVARSENINNIMVVVEK